ncbi:MAG: hypothetical protein ACTSRW_13660 [Candidatus Helarchaeota archaeon]
MSEEIENIKNILAEIPKTLNQLSQSIDNSFQKVEKYFSLVDDKLKYLTTDFKVLEEYIQKEDKKNYMQIEELVKRLDNEMRRIRHYFDLDRLNKTIQSIVDLQNRMSFDIDEKKIQETFKSIMEFVKKL